MTTIEHTDAEWLRGLASLARDGLLNTVVIRRATAETLRDYLLSIAARIETATYQSHPNGKPKWAPDGTLLDDEGNRSLFDDVDQ